MFYLKINDELFEASFAGKNNDTEWDGRESKTITTSEFTYEEASLTFVDDLEWYITEQYNVREEYAYNAQGQIITDLIDPETGEYVEMYDAEGNRIETPLVRVVTKERDFDNSEYNVAGSIIDNRDGSLSIKMGKTTDLEEAYELLYGGNE